MKPPSKPRSTPGEVGRCSFPPITEEIQRVVAFVAGLARQAGVAPEKAIRLELALEEWVVNLCRHAYSRHTGQIEVSVRKEAGGFLVEIADEGPPFDLTASAEPDLTLPLADREPGGLGLVLIRRMVDEVRYARDGRRNIVTLAIAMRQS